MSRRTEVIEITRPADRVADVLEAVLNGRIPNVHHLGPILVAHGWPNRADVRDNITQLRRLGSLDVTFEIEVRKED